MSDCLMCRYNKLLIKSIIIIQEVQYGGYMHIIIIVVFVVIHHNYIHKFFSNEV